MKLSVPNVTCTQRTVLKPKTKSSNWKESSKLHLTTFPTWRMKLIAKTRHLPMSITLWVWFKEKSKSSQEYCKTKNQNLENCNQNLELSILNMRCRPKSLRTSVRIMKNSRSFSAIKSMREIFLELSSFVEMMNLLFFMRRSRSFRVLFQRVKSSILSV